MKKCPYCAEEIQNEAVKCRYCGEFLQKRKRQQRELSTPGFEEKEKVIFEKHPVRWCYSHLFILTIVLPLVVAVIMHSEMMLGLGVAVLIFIGTGVVIGVLIYLGISLAIRTRTYTLTTQRLIVRYGIFAKQTREVELVDIRNINIHQTILSRMLNYGSLEVGTAATSQHELFVEAIQNPSEARDIIRTEKSKRSGPAE